MDVVLKRIARRDTYTIGRFFMDGEQVCDSLEPKDRGLTSSMSRDEIAAIKVPSKTAIPTGRYRIGFAYSPRFSHRYTFLHNGLMPVILNVPGFQGILIHSGNTERDTAACVLVGENTVVGKVMNSVKTLREVYARMIEAHEAGEPIYITIS